MKLSTLSDGEKNLAHYIRESFEKGIVEKFSDHELLIKYRAYRRSTKTPNLREFSQIFR